MCTIQESDRENKTTLSLLLLCAVLTILLRAPLWSSPWTRDEGEFGLAAQQILKGHLPYTTFVDHKPPLVHCIFALPLALFGPDNYVAVRIASTVLFLAGALYLFGLGRMFTSRRGALFILLLYITASLGLKVEGYVVTTEILMTLPMAAFFFFLLRGKKYDLFISGICGGASLLVRPTFLFFYLAACIYLVTISYRERKELIPGGMGSFLGGFLILPGLTFALYLACGLIKELYVGLFLLNKVYALNINRTLLQTMQQALMIYGSALRENPLFFIVPLISIPLFLLKEKDARKKLFIVLATIVSLYVTFSTMMYARNLIQLLPVWALMGGWGIESVMSLLPSRGRYTAYAALGLSMVYFFACVVPYNLNVTDRDRYKTIMPESFLYAREVGLELRRISLPEDPVMNWGAEYEMTFFTLRPNPMKYLFQMLLFTSWCDARGNHSFRRELISFQEAILASLRATPPKFIVVTAPFFSYDPEIYYLPGEMEKMIARDYHFALDYRGYRIYRRD